MRKWIVVVLAGVISLGGSVAADTTSVADGDDTPGALDISEAGHGHRRMFVPQGTQRLLKHTVRTHEEWGRRVLRGPSRIEIEFYLGDGGRPQRNLFIDVDRHGFLYAKMIVIGRKRGGTVLGYARVWRPDPHTVKVEFPKRLLWDGELSSYRWRVRTEFVDPASEECPGMVTDVYVSCVDQAPDSRLILHQL